MTAPTPVTAAVSCAVGSRAVCSSWIPFVSLGGGALERRPILSLNQFLNFDSRLKTLSPSEVVVSSVWRRVASEGTAAASLASCSVGRSVVVVLSTSDSSCGGSCLDFRFQGQTVSALCLFSCCFFFKNSAQVRPALYN